MNIDKTKRILIIRLSSLGDILLTYPLIKLIKEKEIGTEIHFLVKEEFLDAIKYNQFVDRIITYSRHKQNSIRDQIKENNYDIIIDLQNNFRSRNLYCFTGNQRIFRFKKPTFKKLLLVKFKINLLKDNPSIAVNYIKSFYPDFNAKPELYFRMPEDIESEILAKHKIKFNKNMAGFCPGSKHVTKRYPVDKFREVILQLVNKGFEIALLGGKDDFEICKNLEIHPSVKNFQNENDLLETAVIMKRCRVIISNDSGLMHLASLLQVPVIAIFGSTVREFGFFPIFEKSIRNIFSFFFWRSRSY